MGAKERERESILLVTGGLQYLTLKGKDKNWHWKKPDKIKLALPKTIEGKIKFWPKLQSAHFEVEKVNQLEMMKFTKVKSLLGKFYKEKDWNFAQEKKPDPDENNFSKTETI